MSFRRSLLGLLTVALAFFYALGTSGAAVACASPAAVCAPAAPAKPCHGEGQAHDCAPVCAPTCTATIPPLAEVQPPPQPLILSAAIEVRQLKSHAMRPEPPPPRMSSI